MNLCLVFPWGRRLSAYTFTMNPATVALDFEVSVDVIFARKHRVTLFSLLVKTLLLLKDEILEFSIEPAFAVTLPA